MSPTGGSINRLGGSQYECRGQIGGTGDVSPTGPKGSGVGVREYSTCRDPRQPPAVLCQARRLISSYSKGD